MTKMTAGCIETSLMTIILVIVCLVIGFVGGYYYEKEQSKKQQVKENFYSLSSGEIAGIVVGAILFIVFILWFAAKSGTGVLDVQRQHTRYYRSRY